MPVIEALRYRLHSAELLLILDNCEHLLGACSAPAEALLGSSLDCASPRPAGSRWAFPARPSSPCRRWLCRRRRQVRGRQRAPAVRLFLARSALDLVDLLAGKSLVVGEPAAGGTRYRLLETIRQYAAGRLAEAGEAEQARGRHAGAFLALAERERRAAASCCASTTTSVPPWTTP